MKKPATCLALLQTIVGLTLPLAVRTTTAPIPDEVDPLDAVAQVTSLPLSAWQCSPLIAGLGCLALLCIAGSLLLQNTPRAEAGLSVASAAAGLALPLAVFADGLSLGTGAWIIAAAAIVILVRGLNLLADRPGIGRSLVVPGLFGVALLVLWEIAVRGLHVPLVLLPPPSLIAATFVRQWATLAGDFTQTILRSALRGYVMGCSAGFILAVACDRIPFLKRGLLPYASLVSAIPMIGIAPIMIMWFGFGWQSKAAVVVVVTVFPMLINTLAGLAATDRLQLDLMRSYGAGYWRTLLKVRLPNAAPFVFTALKVNSTFALISAIVAEFFGTPIAGMGFRISTEVARMNLSTVWATIVVAALTGSTIYAGLALVERALTFWHPSYRKR